MSKISLIIQREYLTRVKKKSFIVMTILTPFLIAAVAIVPTWLTHSVKDETVKKVAIVDETGNFAQVIKGKETVHFDISDQSFDEVKSNFKKKDYYAVLHIKKDLVKSPDALTIYSDKAVGMEVKSLISNQLENHIREKKMDNYDIEGLDQILEEVRTKVKPTTIKWGKDGEGKKTSEELVMVIGIVAGLIIYMFIFMYGVQVMRGVIEEKTNRIVEVMVSSVKPFQLMMGKILGIALVALTQFFLWVVLTVSIFLVIQVVMLPDDFQEIMQQRTAIQQGVASGNMPEIENEAVANVMTMLGGINFKMILSFFLFFFIGGYLLYSSLFAAIGSAVDNETDTQQFMLPITLPIIFALYVGMAAVNNPHGPIAVWCSIIPLTSPIVMMVRIPFDVPVWQLVLSIGVLILTFLGTTMLAAKIYRTGVLMYGKKINYKELFKWLKYKS